MDNNYIISETINKDSVNLNNVLIDEIRDKSMTEVQPTTTFQEIIIEEASQNNGIEIYNNGIEIYVIEKKTSWYNCCCHQNKNNNKNNCCFDAFWNLCCYFSNNQRRLANSNDNNYKINGCSCKSVINCFKCEDCDCECDCEDD